MKSLKKMFAAIVIATIVLTQVGCFGSFPLTRQVWEFNRDVGGKIAQEAVFLAFMIIPVYGVTTFIDFWILNTIEFWTGDTPMSMKEGEMDKKLVSNGDKTYEVIATKNQYLIKQIEGPEKGREVKMLFDPETAIWSFVDGKENVDLVKIMDNDHVQILTGDAEGMVYNIHETDARSIKSQLMNEAFAKK